MFQVLGIHFLLIFALKMKLPVFLHSEKEGCSTQEGSWQRAM